nr:hypothetical protein [Tanacetum cinerariifolium]
ERHLHLAQQRLIVNLQMVQMIISLTLRNAIKLSMSVQEFMYDEQGLWLLITSDQHPCFMIMASKQRSSGPALNEMTPGIISSGLAPTTSPLTSYVPPSRNDWDLLFQPMFDELLNPPPSVVNQAPEAIAPIDEVIPPVNADSTGSPSSTTVEQDAPSTSNSTTPTETQSSIIPQDVGDENLDIEVAHMGSDPLFSIPIPKVNSEQSTTPTSFHPVTTL